MWLTGRWRAYVRRAGILATLAIEHAPWTLRTAMLDACEQTLTNAVGLPAPSAEPVAHYSPGVDAARIGLPRPVF